MTDPIERDFPNIERLLAGLLAPDFGGDDHVGSETPDDLEARLPFLRVVRIGGARTHQYDYPVVDLDVFDVDEAAGAPRASRLANRLLAKPPPHPSIDVVSCEPAFRELPWGDSESVRRWGATFFLETRMVRVALLP
jgi:hypothetical protein